MTNPFHSADGVSSRRVKPSADASTRKYFAIYIQHRQDSGRGLFELTFSPLHTCLCILFYVSCAKSLISLSWSRRILGHMNRQMTHHLQPHATDMVLPIWVRKDLPALTRFVQPDISSWTTRPRCTHVHFWHLSSFVSKSNSHRWLIVMKSQYKKSNSVGKRQNINSWLSSRMRSSPHSRAWTNCGIIMRSWVSDWHYLHSALQTYSAYHWLIGTHVSCVSLCFSLVTYLLLEQAGKQRGCWQCGWRTMPPRRESWRRGRGSANN